MWMQGSRPLTGVYLNMDDEWCLKPRTPYICERYGGSIVFNKTSLFKPLTYYFSLVSVNYRWTRWVWEVTSWGLGSSRKMLGRWTGCVWELTGWGLRLQKTNHHKWTRRVWEIIVWSSWLRKITNHFKRNSQVMEENNVRWMTILPKYASGSWMEATFHSCMQT